MGMFDTVKISLHKLPLTKSELKKLGHDPWFQTKDFDCVLTNIRIDDDGSMTEDKWETELVPKEERPYPDDEGILGCMGMLKHVNERTEKMDFTGIFHFYTNSVVDDEWFEFQCEADKGVMKTIIRVPGDF